MTPGLIQGLGPPVIGFPVRVCHQSLHRLKRKMGFPSCVASSGLVPLGLAPFPGASGTRRFQLPFDGAAIPAPFQCLITHPRHVGTGQAMLSLACGVNRNTFSAPLKGFQGQHCSFCFL